MSRAGDGKAPTKSHSRPDADAVDQAKQMLRAELASGPRPASDVEAAIEARVSRSALMAAKSSLGVVASRLNSGHGNAVHLSLP